MRPQFERQLAVEHVERVGVRVVHVQVRPALAGGEARPRDRDLLTFAEEDHVARRPVADRLAVRPQRQLHRALGVQARGVEGRHRRVLRPDQQVDLRAAEQDRLRATVGEAAHDAPVPLARAVVDDADAELSVDHVVDDAPVVGVGHEHLEPVRVAQPADVELLLHRVRGGEQADAGEAGRAHGARSRVGDVHERDVDRRDDRIGHLVHGVRAQHEQLGPAGDECPGLVGEPLARLVPPPAALQLLDVGEVHGAQQAVGGVQPAEALARDLVDEPVVLDRGLPAHPPEQADALHCSRTLPTPALPPPPRSRRGRSSSSPSSRSSRAGTRPRRGRRAARPAAWGRPATTRRSGP